MKNHSQAETKKLTFSSISHDSLVFKLVKLHELLSSLLIKLYQILCKKFWQQFCPKLTLGFLFCDLLKLCFSSVLSILIAPDTTFFFISAIFISASTEAIQVYPTHNHKLLVRQNLFCPSISIWILLCFDLDLYALVGLYFCAIFFNYYVQDARTYKLFQLFDAALESKYQVFATIIIPLAY